MHSVPVLILADDPEPSGFSGAVSCLPQRPTILGVGAAGSLGMAAAIGGGTAVASEALRVSVTADAKRAAQAVADLLIQA